jgi:hypothetical protein
LCKTLFGKRKKEIICSTILDSTKFMSINLPPIDNNLPFQQLKCFCSLSSTIFYSEIVSLHPPVIPGVPSSLLFSLLVVGETIVLICNSECKPARFQLPSSIYLWLHRSQAWRIFMHRFLGCSKSYRSIWLKPRLNRITCVAEFLVRFFSKTLDRSSFFDNQNS